MFNYWSRLIRLPNLLIVALTQFTIYYTVFLPVFKRYQIQADLDFFHFCLLVLDTVLIAAGGYIINDIIDYPIDKINKPDRLIINKQISARTATGVYISSIIIGFILAFYLAVYVNNIPLVSLHLIGVGLLYLYSKYFKRMPFWGNLVVGLFCAFVPGIIWFAERFTFARLKELDPKAWQVISIILGAYLLFALLSTILREIIKDIEDIEGDLSLGYRTLPIAYGIPVAKKTTLLFGISMISLLIYGVGLLYHFQRWLDIGFIILFIIVPTLLLLVRLNRSERSQEFGRLSKLGKYIMLSGILYLVLYCLQPVIEI